VVEAWSLLWPNHPLPKDIAKDLEKASSITFPAGRFHCQYCFFPGWIFCAVKHMFLSFLLLATARAPGDHFLV
jgi:hypothetical protein